MSHQKFSNEALLTHVCRLMHDGDAASALEALRQAHSEAPLLRNALGVALLRTGNAAEAVQVFRDLSLVHGGVSFRSDVPLAYKLNLAAAVFLSGNPGGAQSILHEIHADRDPHGQRLLAALAAWRRQLTWSDRLRVAVLGECKPALAWLPFPPGELDGHVEETSPGVRPAA